MQKSYLKYNHNPSPPWILEAIFFCCLIAAFNVSGASPNWKDLAPGVRYADLNSDGLTPWSHIHVFEINLTKNRLKIALAKDINKNHASVERLAAENNALLAINGGFFDTKYQPLGLRMSEGNRINNLKRISWWGVFYTRRNRAFLTSPKQYIPFENVDFAIQSGPRLIVNRRIPSLKPGKAQRSAIGINTNGSRIYLVVTENNALSTTALAKKMLGPPLNCRYALNLDGGSSTQLSAHLNNFNLSVHGLSNVSDAILVVPRHR